jgi:RHS repeat-associated protein
VLVGTTKHSYTPDGTGPPPDNSDGDYDYGWLGSHQRPTDHGLPTTVVQMGARPYVPSLGRFLSVDPIEAGSCNDYDYVCGDPVNGLDLTGTKKKSKEPLPDLEAHCGYNAPNDVFYGEECLHYRTAKANDDSSIYFDFVGKGRRYHEPQISRIECPGWLRDLAGFIGVGGFARAARFDEDSLKNAQNAYLSGEFNRLIGEYAGVPVKLSVYATAFATAIDGGCAAIGY